MQHCVCVCAGARCGGAGVLSFSGVVFGVEPGLYHVRQLFRSLDPMDVYNDPERASASGERGLIK